MDSIYSESPKVIGCIGRQPRAIPQVNVVTRGCPPCPSSAGFDVIGQAGCVGLGQRGLFVIGVFVGGPVFDLDPIAIGVLKAAFGDSRTAAILPAIDAVQR